MTKTDHNTQQRELNSHIFFLLGACKRVIAVGERNGFRRLALEKPFPASKCISASHSHESNPNRFRRRSASLVIHCFSRFFTSHRREPKFSTKALLAMVLAADLADSIRSRSALDSTENGGKQRGLQTLALIIIETWSEGCP